MSNFEAFASLLVSEGFNVTFDEPMKKHTSFKIGGCADVFVTIGSKEKLSRFLTLANENDVPYIILGNGTNMLVSDKGIRGAVVRLDGDFCKIEKNGENGIVSGAGAMLSRLCQAALSESLTGLEFAYGIPGSVGGAVYMNAGAYGGEIKDCAVSCEYMSRDGETHTLSNEELDFRYRGSFFTGTDNIILSASFELTKGDSEEIKAKMHELMGRRSDKQPLELPSAGSVFKRPVGYFAGGLIEQCGLKGCTVGGAQVSKKHAGFIVNIGDATCEDVLGLVKHIQNTVKTETGVDLECEIKTIGEV